MNLTSMKLLPASSRAAKRALRWTGVAAIGLLCLLGTGCFQVSRDTDSLRTELIQASGAQWQKQFEIGVGGLAAWVARTGLSFAPLEADAHRALEAVRGGDLAIYRLKSGEARPAPANLLAAADRVLSKRNWDRLVVVIDGRQFVGIYVPSATTPMRDMKVCVVVADGKQLVVASARSNLEPLMEIAFKHSGRIRNPEISQGN